MMDRVRDFGVDRRRAGGRWLASGLAFALMAGVPLTGGAGVAAQERSDTTSCRCVDARGNEIENCRCLRVFSGESLRGLMTTEPMRGLVTAMSVRRAVIGVIIDVGQGSEADRDGALIQQVQEDSPAAEAGMEEGDLVVRVDGQSVFDPLPDAEAEAALDLDRSIPVQRFQHLVGALEPGEPADFEVRRDGRSVTLTITPERGGGVLTLPGMEGALTRELRLRGDQRLEELRLNSENLRERMEELGRERWTQDRPGVYRFEAPRGEGRAWVFVDSIPRVEGEGFVGSFRLDPCMRPRDGQGARVWALGAGNCVDGVEFVELNPELGEYFGTDEGVLVAEVAEESELGLRPGDVLVAVDGREVTDADQVRRILGSYGPDEEMRLRVRRRGQEMEVLGRRR